MYIEKLQFKPFGEGVETLYWNDAPDNIELMNKINEIIEVINNQSNTGNHIPKIYDSMEE